MNGKRQEKQRCSLLLDGQYAGTVAVADTIKGYVKNCD